MPFDAAQLDGVTLAILAGGEGARMGRPKAELAVRGRPILDYLLNRLSWPGPTMLVTAPDRELPPGTERFDREVVDSVAGEGPLRGVLTALEAAHTDLLFLTTVDMPGVTTSQACWLLDRMAENPPARGVMCCRVGYVEPFPVLLRTSVLEALRGRFDAGERSVASMARHECVAVAEPDWPDAVWVNLNRPADFERWLARV